MRPWVCDRAGLGFSVQLMKSADKSEKSQLLDVHSSCWRSVSVTELLLGRDAPRLLIGTPTIGPVWDIAGKTCVITGASRGIGRATAEGLADRGAIIVAAGRPSAERSGLLKALRRSGSHHIAVDLDLGSLASVRRAGEAIGKLGKLGVLVANAGVVGRAPVTEDGFERTFAVNHLGHFLLASLLSNQLDGGRLVVVSSNAHFDAMDWNCATLSRTERATGFEAYRRSKLANVLFVREAARRWPAVTSVAVHPGMVASEIWRPVPQPIRWWLMRRMATPADGATHVIGAATAAHVENGGYYDQGLLRAPSPVAADEDVALRLWEASYVMVGG